MIAILLKPKIRLQLLDNPTNRRPFPALAPDVTSQNDVPPQHSTEVRLLEIVDDRYDKGSLLFTSQVPLSQWP